MWTIFMLTLLLLVRFIIHSKMKRSPSYPPGPTTLPVIGNLLSVILELRKVKYHHKLWKRWALKYGNVFGLRLGVVNVVVVTGRDLIREVSSREDFEGRPDGFFYTMRSFGKKLGIIFADGPKWTSTRRFVLKYLKNFGFNSRNMNNYIEEECKALVRLRVADAGQPVPVNNMFHVAIVNILWRLVAGKRYNLDDERLKHLCDLITRLFKAVDMSGGILNFLPFLRHVIPDRIGYTELKNIHSEIHAFIKETVKEHQNTLDVDNPRDVIDAFLIDMREEKEQIFTMEELYTVCLDLLEAGMETVSNTAVFMILYMVRDQEIQRKVQHEIDEVIGRRAPSVNDRVKMLYTEAVMLETLRMSTIAAVGVPHMALQDATLDNYVIPKGTFILLSLHELHNGSHWKDPSTFRPERFFTKERNLIQDDCLMPFGTGKRRCIGEGLARSELFMFLTYLLQRFNLKIPQGESLPSLDPVNGLTLSPKPFSIVFEPRY